MKVLMINVMCGIRSTGRICTDLADALTAEGHTVKIAYGRGEVPEQYQKYAVQIASDLDVNIAVAEARLFDNAGFSNKATTEKFITWVKRYDPDVIHLHNLHGYYINVEVLFNYLRTCGKKIIWTLHDCWAFTGHSAYCDAAKCERWEKSCYKCPQIKEYPKSFTDNSRRNWQRKKEIFTGIPDMTIVTPSYWLGGLVKRSFLKKYPVEVIHNGIDTTKFYPLKNDFRDVYNLQNKFILLGVATSWDKMKGLDDFLKLAEILGDSYQIVLVGLKKEQIEKLPHNILGIERTNSVKELAYIYSASDLLLNLTYCDTYSNVILEATECGIPSLSYNTGGSAEAAINVGGYVVEQGNLKGLATQISEIKAAGNPKKKGNNKKTNPELDYHAALIKYLRIYEGESVTSEENKIKVDSNMTENHKNLTGGYWTTKTQYGLLTQFVVLGVASTWERRKGLEDFIKLRKMLGNEYMIVLVGVNEEQKKVLPKGVIGVERTNSIDELRRLYGIADVFLNLTYEDNYPTVNLEARACETRVITYRTGGSPESVAEEDVIKTGYIHEIYRKVLKLSENVGGQRNCTSYIL